MAQLMVTVIKLCSVVLISSFVAATDFPKTLVCKSTVFEPYVMLVEGEVRGIDVEVIEEVGRRLGIDIDFKLKPWVRLERDMKAGNEVCAAAYFQTSEREEYMDFTQVPLHITNYVFFVSAENGETRLRLSDMSGFRIGLNNGFKTTPEFEKAVEEGFISVETVENETQSLKMLESGRIDGVLTNEFVGHYLIKKNNIIGVNPVFPPLASTPAFFTFSKSSGLEYLVPEFNTALFELLKDGTYQRIYDKYLGKTKM
jgi:polar amino acid transport system substrate-binding protein